MKKTNKYFRFGLYTSALFILVLSSVLFLCILADTFSVNIDLTEKKIFHFFPILNPSLIPWKNRLHFIIWKTKVIQILR